MKEIHGDLWELKDRYNQSVVCITTNGFVKSNGLAVMGRGCALQAARRYPGLAARLGELIVTRGNKPHWLTMGVVSFPVKHNWYDTASLSLIAASATWLKKEADNLRPRCFLLPRPGCGNGKLDWHCQVRPLLESLELPDNILIVSYQNEI